jgi:hypothetical protein
MFFLSPENNPLGGEQNESNAVFSYPTPTNEATDIFIERLF